MAFKVVKLNDNLQDGNLNLLKTLDLFLGCSLQLNTVIIGHNFPCYFWFKYFLSLSSSFTLFNIVLFTRYSLFQALAN